MAEPARSAARGPDGDTRARTRALLCAASLVLVAVPFAAAPFVPATDLPQHVSQIPLFLRAVSDPGAGLIVQWSTPYALVYALIGACWALAPPLEAGRIAVLVLALSIAAGIHLVAARRGRSVSTAVLVTALVFGPSLYWGFMSFLAGAALFLPWLAAFEEGPSRRGTVGSVAMSLMAVLVYFAHALWLGAIVLWTVLWILRGRPARREIQRRILEIAPASAVALVWFLEFSRSRYANEFPTFWLEGPVERLHPAWLVDAALGGVRGALEPLFLSFLAVWVIAGCLQARGRLRGCVDARLLEFGALLILCAIVMPDRYMHTIYFGVRWMSFGVGFVALALPAPRWRPAARYAAALAALAVFCAATAHAWRLFARAELSGLRASLDALPADRRVLGLDDLVESTWIKGRPFLQIPAYAQVARDARLGFSFAEFASSFVVYDGSWRREWTSGLTWNAVSVRRADLPHFDYVLIGAPRGSPQREMLMRTGLLEPVTRDDVWRLYRVTPDRGSGSGSGEK